MFERLLKILELFGPVCMRAAAIAAYILQLAATVANAITSLELGEKKQVCKTFLATLLTRNTTVALKKIGSAAAFLSDCRWYP